MNKKTTGWLEWKQNTSYEKQAEKPFTSLENRSVIPQNQYVELLDRQGISVYDEILHRH